MNMSSRRRLTGQSRGSQMPLIWLALFTGVLLLGVAVLAQFSQANATASRSGNTVEFTLDDFSGNPVSLSSFRGRPVLVNLWASWCPPCRAEMPTLIQFYKDHQTGGFALLAVNTGDDKVAAQQFMSQVQMPFKVLYDPDGRAEHAFGTDGLPSSFLIDRNGAMVFSWTGQITRGVLDSRVAPLLSQ